MVSRSDGLKHEEESRKAEKGNKNPKHYVVNVSPSSVWMQEARHGNPQDSPDNQK